MENKKDTGLIVLVILLVLLVLGLGGYIAYDKLFRSNDSSSLVSKDSFVISSEKRNNSVIGGYDVLVINGKSIEKKQYIYKNNIHFIDSSHILVKYESYDGLFTNYYIFDNNGNELYDFRKLISIEDPLILNVSYDSNTSTFNVFEDLMGDENPCEYNKGNGIVAVNEQIRYLGNGKLDKSEVISSKTASDVALELFGQACLE